MNAGRKLRSLREELAITMRDVETLSARIASQHDNEEFSIPPSRLSDLETKGVLPSLYRFYSLSVLYGVPILDLLSWYGVSPSPTQRQSRSNSLGTRCCIHR
jgi:hypothetical protein